MYNKILNVSEQLFITQGYQGTSTRQISDILNVTQPTLYYHFKNKESIYYNVMLRMAADIEKNLRQLKEVETASFAEKILTMADFLRVRHPFNLFVMMHDIKYSLSKEVADKLYVLWLKAYKAPFVELFEENQANLRASVAAEVAVSQLFILLAAYLDQPEKSLDLATSIELFLYGVLDKQTDSD